MLIIALSWSLVCAVILLLVLRQFRVIRRVTIVSDPPAKLPRLTVIVPARNEAANIERCLQALKEQVYSDLEIILVNDASTDNTAEIARVVMAGDQRFRLVDGKPLEQGWKGKPNACWHGASASTCDWLCFVDADTVLVSPYMLSSVITEAMSAGLDMLSCQTFQELGSFWERVIYPAGFTLLLLLIDIDRINDGTKPDAAANGQFLLIRRDVYEKVGGHSAPSVRGQFVEDMALARLVKRNGFRLSLMLGDNGIHTRMYVGFKQMWNGFSRIVVDIFHGPLVSVLAAGAALFVGCLPLGLAGPLAISGNLLGLLALVPGIAAMSALHFMVVNYLELPWRYGFTFPLGYFMGASILINGAWQRKFTGVPWRGRLY